MITGQDIEKRIQSLPPLSRVAQEVIKITSDPEASPRDLARVIGYDQNLTTNLLKLANSAYYGLPHQVSSIYLAVALLGFNTIRSIVLTSSTQKLLSREVTYCGIEEGALWLHSLRTAFVARAIAREYQYRGQSEEVYVAGLLHDVGKVILEMVANDKDRQNMQEFLKREIPLMDAEREVFGVDHAQIGGEIALRWGLPEELAEIVEFHHHPHIAEKAPVVTSFVYMANLMCVVREKVDMSNIYANPEEIEVFKKLGAISGLREKLEIYFQEEMESMGKTIT